MESIPSIDAALSNVLILDKIVGFSSSPGSLRLVCKQWNDVILAGTSPSTALNVVSLPYGENRAEFEQFLKSLDSRIFKRIRISLRDIYPPVLDDDNIKALSQVHTKLVHICETLGPHIRQLDILWWSDIVPALFSVLGSGLCPNLKTLRLNFKAQYPDTYKRVSPSFLPKGKIEAMPYLNRIKFIYAWPVKLDEIYCSPNFVITFFHDLLSASPKLQSLEVESFYCPGLDSNKELREFRFLYQSRNISWNRWNTDPVNPIRNFNWDSLSNILEQIKDSLEVLQLATREMNKNRESTLKIPVMPKLVTFLYFERCWDNGLNANLKQLWRDRMPSLVHLSVFIYGCNDDTNGAAVLDNLLLLQNNKIKRLKLTGVPLQCRYSFIEKLSGLRTPFPDLESLELGLWQGQDGLTLDRDECGELVGKTMKYCSTLGLNHLRIKTEFSYGLRKMVEVLWECGQDQVLFLGLKTLEVINDDVPECVVSDDLFPDGEIRLQEILIMTKGMTSLVFDGFLMRFEHAKRLSEFIADNKLPVRFLN